MFIKNFVRQLFRPRYRFHCFSLEQNEAETFSGDMKMCDVTYYTGDMVWGEDIWHPPEEYRKKATHNKVGTTVETFRLSLDNTFSKLIFFFVFILIALFFALLLTLPLRFHAKLIFHWEITEQIFNVNVVCFWYVFHMIHSPRILNSFLQTISMTVMEYIENMYHLKGNGEWRDLFS